MHFVPTSTRLAVAIALVASTSGTAQALDARALALGGSVIAAGEGAPGALANPASLVDMQRRGERTHVSFGAGAEARVSSELVDIATDEGNDGLLDDLEREFEAIDLREVTTECQAAAVSSAAASLAGVAADPALDGTICLDGLRGLSTLAGRTIDIGDAADAKTPEGFGGGGLGLAFTHRTYPFALHLETRATGRGRLDFAPGDRDYLGEVQTTLSDDVLTFGEITDTAEFVVNPESGTLEVEQPETTFQSGGRGGYVARVTFGASLARSFDIDGFALDVGVTPKLSSYVAQGIATTAEIEFDNESESLQDRFDDSETTGSSFNLDVGASTTHTGWPVPVTFAAVLRNLVPETVEVEMPRADATDGASNVMAFDTTPQLVVGAAATIGPVAVNGDLALNEAEVDGRETQVLALGLEYERGLFAARAGINHEAARDEAPTALSLGFGIGPVDLGLRATSTESAYGALQLSLTF